MIPLNARPGGRNKDIYIYIASILRACKGKCSTKYIQNAYTVENFGGGRGNMLVSKNIISVMTPIHNVN